MVDIFCLRSAYAQGNNIFGVIKSPGAQESYGIYATRHHRRGEETGIGGSFVETTSDTSESSPAIIPHSIAPVVHNEIDTANELSSIYGNAHKTPALYSALTKQYFDIGLEKGMQKPITSPALTAPSRSSWAAIESPLIKKPATVIEPIERINLHRTGGRTASPYE